MGQLAYDTLDDNQKSIFQKLVISPEIWSFYVNNNTEEIDIIFIQTSKMTSIKKVGINY
jgi:hypothetical protein